MAISDTSWGIIHKKEAAQTLLQVLQEDPVIDGRLIFGWPMGPAMNGNKGSFACDAVLVSPKGHVTIIDLAQPSDPEFPGNYQARQDHAYNIARAAVAVNQGLVERRNLKVYVQTVTFAHDAVETDPDNSETPMVNTDQVAGKIREFQARSIPEIDPDQVYHSLIDS